MCKTWFNLTSQLHLSVDNGTKCTFIIKLLVKSNRFTKGIVGIEIVQYYRLQIDRIGSWTTLKEITSQTDEIPSQFVLKNLCFWRQNDQALVRPTSHFFQWKALYWEVITWFKEHMPVMANSYFKQLRVHSTHSIIDRSDPRQPWYVSCQSSSKTFLNTFHASPNIGQTWSV